MEYVSFPNIERQESNHGFGCWKTIKWRLVTIEPAMFLLALAYGLSAPTHQAVFYRKVCLSLYNTSICDNLYYNESFKTYIDETQKNTAQWLYYANICFTIPSLVAVALYGSWSDRFSRKVPLLFAPVGSLLNTACFLLNAIFMESNISYLLIGQILDGLSGGFTTFLMAAFSYLNHVSHVEQRTSRISIVYSAQTLALGVSAFSSGVLLDHTSFLVVYSIVMCLLIVMIIYIVFMVEDIDPRTDITDTDCIASYDTAYSGLTETSKTHVYLKDLSFCGKMAALFTFSHMKEAFVVTFKKRPGKTRRNILILIAVGLGIMVTYAVSVIYLFLRHPPLGWDQTLYGYYAGFGAFVHFTGQAVFLPFLKSTFRIRDNILLIFAIVSDMAGRLWTGFCVKTWMMFLTPFISYMMPFNFTCIRALLSKMVNGDEVGKIYAVVAWLETLGALAAASLYSDWIYPRTVDIYAGISFIISALLMVIPLALAVWFFILLTKPDMAEEQNRSSCDIASTQQQINDMIEQIQQTSDSKEGRKVSFME